MRNLYRHLKKQKIVYTHSGNFHADDVFATALIKKINPNITITRTLDLTFPGFYYDLGLGDYDHHQEDATWRTDKSTKYCSFGLIWRDAGKYLVSKKRWKVIDEVFVKQIDIADNTPNSNIFSATIARFNPTWDKVATEQFRNECFDAAVNFATLVLDYFIDSDHTKLFEICSIMCNKQAITNQADQRAYTAIKKEGKLKSGILVLERFIPFKDYCEDHKEIKYVIYPSLRGGYSVQTPAHYDNITKQSINICPLPEGIAQLPGFIFRHATGFLATFNSEAEAINAAKYGIKVDKKVKTKQSESI